MKNTMSSLILSYPMTCMSKHSKVCGATKRTRVELLERHIYKHTTERTMECPYCDIISKNSGKGFFKTKQSLIQHVDHMHKDRVM